MRFIARQQRAMNCPTTNRITYKLNIEALIGYQWARYSSIELALSYDRYWRGSTRRSWDFSTPFVHHIGIFIELHGILW